MTCMGVAAARSARNLLSGSEDPLGNSNLRRTGRRDTPQLDMNSTQWRASLAGFEAGSAGSL